MTSQNHLTPRSLERVTYAWHGALGLHQSPVSALTFVARDDFTSVVAVELQGQVVVAAPESVLDRLRALDPQGLVDARAVERAIDGSVAIGTADLFFADAQPAIAHHAVRPTTDDDLARVANEVTSAEWDESGITELSSLWTMPADNGLPAAIAGYSVWRSDLAQIGVVATPIYRGHGYAMRAAGAAVADAVEAGLIAQWRSRVGNVASATLAERLGLSRLGTQMAVGLA